MLHLAHRTPTRDDLLAIMEAALVAVDPAAAVHRAMHREGDVLALGTQRIDLATIERVIVLGAGKAGAPMAQAVEALLGDRIAAGYIIVKDDHSAPTSRITLSEASHPMPNAAGLAASEALLALADGATDRDLVIVLLSGGGSALLEALPAPLTLDDLRATTEALLASGATINEVNAVRKHLSRVKGGQLARAIAPATLVTLVLSDVVGSPLDVIASGPTVPDESTWVQVAAILERYALHEHLPPAVRERLEAGIAGQLPDTPKADDPLFAGQSVHIIGDNAIAAEAAKREAEARGYHSAVLTTFLEGEAREVARVAVALGREVVAHGRPVPAPACLILGGETTVTLRGTPGRGGRNQELALAATQYLVGDQRITIGALATDGTDGPTDSAGAIVDGGSAERAAVLGRSLADALACHDAYPLLDATGDLLISGPTQTNVNDLLFVMVNGE